MLQLPYGCTASQPSVFPKNWLSGGNALLKFDWRIQYYFKDPDHKRKLVIVKGMNCFKTVSERRQATQELLNNELRLLQVEGYNPVTKTTRAPEPDENHTSEINGNTPFIHALRKTLDRLTVEKNTRQDMSYTIDAVEKAARQFGIHNLEIEKVSRRNIKNLLEQCGKNSKQWSAHRFNAYRGYLMMLYKELVELEAAPANPLRDISKKNVTLKIKDVLSVEQRKVIDDHLAAVFPEFRQFVHLFFHSGGRKTELLQLKPGMVNLEKQTYRCIVKKRKNYTEVERTIKSIAIPYWKYFIENCHADYFLFGPRFQPALKPMGQEMPTVYWKKYVKKELGITVGFYNLKHLHTTEVVDFLSEKYAAIHNSHTSTSMVINIYDTRQKQRAHDRLKGLDNKFA